MAILFARQNWGERKPWHHIYHLSSSFHHLSEYGTSSMGTHLVAKAHITMWTELTEWEVTEFNSSMVNDTALAILRRQGCRRITIVRSQTKFILDIQVQSILTELTHKILQTGSEGLWNIRNSPRHVQSLPHFRSCFRSCSLECYNKSCAMRLLYSIQKWPSAAIH